MTAKVVALAIAGTLAFAACTGGRPEGRPSPTPTTPAARPPASLAPQVVNRGLGRDRHLIARGVRDLRRLGVWDDLTRKNYVIRIASFGGVERIPEDGHLADAVPLAARGPRGSQSACRIRFYSTAMERELQVANNRLRVLGFDLITRQQLWSSVLAHELAHCVGARGRGERFARGWEETVLTLLQSRRWKT